MGLADRLHPDREGFDHRAFGLGDRFGQLETECGRVNDFGCQAAMDRRRRPEGQRRVEIVEADPAGTG